MVPLYTKIFKAINITPTLALSFLLAMQKSTEMKVQDVGNKSEEYWPH